MRVLFVAPYAPSRIRVRPYGFVRHLARRHDVRVLALAIGGLSRDTLTDIGELRREGIPVTIVEEPRHRPYLRALRSAFLPQRVSSPLQVAYTASPALRAAVTAELRARWYDVVHVEHVRGLGSLPLACQAPVVWDAVDCVSLLYEQGARNAATPLLQAVGQIEARRLRAFERRYLDQLDDVLVTSERDRCELLKLVSADVNSGRTARITVLPHGIDPPMRQVHGGERQPDTLIFSGKMDYHANIAGALTLVREIMPLVWRQRPQVRLIIAGSNPPGMVRHLARDERISVTGYVPDLSMLVRAASVAVSPLPYAVGIQNKILEAMATGTPVVASGSSALGLRAVSNLDLLVADTPEEFAVATLRLLDGTETWNTIAENGLRYVATHHNWDVIIEKLTTVYERARDVRIPPMAQQAPRPPQPPQPQAGEVTTSEVVAERTGYAGKAAS